MKEKILYDIYIVTKPLQYINVLNINTNNKKFLLLVANFSNAKDFFDSINVYSKHWEQKKLFEDRISSLKWLKKNKKIINNIFIDSDYGFVNNFYLFLLRHKRIVVYEEGIGTYRTEIKYNKKGIIRKSIHFILYNVLSYNNHIGGSNFTKEIVVYLPKLYERLFTNTSKNISTFYNPFITHLLHNEELKKLFPIDLNITESKIILYLSGWQYNTEVLSKTDFSKYDYFLIKPHPHIKKKEAIELSKYGIVLPNQILAEIVIIDLLQKNNKITLLSSFSTSVVYFSNHRNVTIKNFPLEGDCNLNINYQKTFLEIIKYISDLPNLSF